MKSGRPNKNNSNLKQLTLRDLLDVKKWQKILDNFSCVTNISFRTFDSECRPVTKPSYEVRLCHQLIKDTFQKERFCDACLPTFLGGKWVADKNLSFTCTLGLWNFTAPLKINGKTWGYLIAGPVILVKRKLKSEYSDLAEELNLDLDELWGALLDIKVISFHGMQSILELIQDVGVYTIEIAYDVMVEKKEKRMEVTIAKMKRILDTLLDVAFEVTKADIGSIMFFDKTKRELTIQSAKGLADNVVKTTRVKLGDRISGLVAKEGESFLITDNIQDNRIRPLLNRPQISSSMVLPFKIENRIMGVMNLGTLRTSALRFNLDNLNLANRLMDLASLALR